MSGLPNSFSSLPKPQQTRELRAAGERERAEARQLAERARHAAAERRRIPVPGKPHGRRRPGDRDLRRFSVAAVLGATARNSPSARDLLAAIETAVPADHLALDGLSGAATVSCTCGEKVEALVNQSTLCSCDRLFLHLGKSIRVVKTEAVDDGEL